MKMKKPKRMKGGGSARKNAPKMMKRGGIAEAGDALIRYPFKPSKKLKLSSVKKREMLTKPKGVRKALIPKRKRS